MIYLLSFFFFLFGCLLNFFSYLFYLNDYSLMIIWNLFELNSLMFNFIILIDWMSMFFFSVVMLISSMVLIYCLDYMSMELNLNRFITLVALFVVSMIFMILSPNLVSIILGWDGLGLISYCLVIYYQNYSSNFSGMITFLSNRVGDVGLLLSISLVLMNSSWNLFYYFNFPILVLLILLICSITKSAQIPFSSWLPKAMAAPTPVSALVHSSTLVTAGVYLMIRYNYLIYSSGVNNILLILSSVTMFLAGLMAMFENDLKKIIALSTLSQLGLMMMILSMGCTKLAFFHLVVHALFKSLLFLTAGLMIHYLLGVQDIRFMGGLVNFIPLNLILLLGSKFSLCGIMFLSGFYSKDLIIEFMLMNKLNLFIMLFLLLGTFFTVIYSFRLMYYLLVSNFVYMKFYTKFIFNKMNVSMILLFFLSVISGGVLNYMIMVNYESIFLTLNLKLMVMYILALGFIFFSVVVQMNSIMIWFNEFSLMTFMDYFLLKDNLNLMFMGKFLYKLDSYWINNFFLNLFTFSNNFSLNYFNIYKFLMFLFLVLLLVI